jgi:hypothetical protein
MSLNLKWHRSVHIGKHDYNVDFDEIPKTAGVYVFLRAHGSTAEALYVGKALNLRGRIKQQFNNRRLMDGIKSAPNGVRRLVYAEFVARPGQQKAKSIEICEKALIRYYLAQGHDLLNIQGVKLRFHEIDSVRADLKSLIPISTKMLTK